MTLTWSQQATVESTTWTRRLLMQEILGNDCGVEIAANAVLPLEVHQDGRDPA